MPWEDIGSVGVGDVFKDRDWVLRCYDFAKQFLVTMAGEPPGEFHLDLYWQDHDLGAYPSLGIWFDGPEDPPWLYIEKCTRLLDALDEAVNWSLLREACAEIAADDEDADEAGDNHL